MNFEKLILSFICGLVAFLYYKLSRWWFKGTKEDTNYYEPLTLAEKMKDWIIILGITALALILFVQSF